MSETVDRKELKGIGGWLVLFQIYIIMCLVSALQSLLVTLFMGSYMIVPTFKPYYIAFLAITFMLALVCVVLFYKKRIAFRPVFIVYGIVAMVSMAAYFIYGMDMSYYSIDISGMEQFLTAFVKGLGIVSFVIGTGIIVAFIIALYRSQRVKNTFVNIKS